jgi:hypothetical protein
MTTKLFLSCILASGLTGLAAQIASAQADNSQATPAAPAQSEPLRPQGYLDPNFGSATDKPRAGTPLQPAAPSTSAQAQTGNGDWYKEAPQPYDHATKPRHFHLPKSKHSVEISDDSRPQQQLAQEDPQPAPQSEEQRQYGDQQPQSSAQPAPQDQPAPEYRHIEPVPEYYSQPNQQAYAQPDQQGYAQPQQQDQEQAQNYADQDYPDQGDNQPSYGPDDQPQQYATQPTQQALGAQQLEQLVAPIALYPDQLLAQMLTASTYPAQITAADQWLHQMNGAQPEQIASAAAAQTEWDPSIKALTAFPQVLDMLNSNLQWTAALGNAYYNQPQDVLNTVQVLRDRAQQAGNLQSTPQEQVTDDPGYIQIQPTDSNYVYVPSYNPWYAYGAPIDPYPDFAFGDWGLYIGGGIRYGLGFAISPFFGMPWGWGAWGLDWAGCGILFNHGYYWSHSREVRDWGFEHGGRRWNGGGRGWYNGGRQTARFGDYHHQAMSVHQGPLGRGFGGPRQPGGRESFGHIRGGGPTRPESPRQQAFGHMPEARPQQFQRGPQSFNNRPQSFAGRPQSFAGRPQQFQRGPQTFPGRPQSFGGREAYPGGGRPLNVRPEPYRSLPQGRALPQSRGFAENRGFGSAPRLGNGYGQYPRPGQGFASRPQPMQNFGGRQFARPGGGFQGRGESFARPQQHFGGGGGFHPFGGGHSAPSYGGGRSWGGGGHAFGGGGHSFGGGGHSFGGGGHSFGGGGGHFGGGGHSFGGGGHGGGGHSGGGGHRR